jgi:hypothetical protein
VVAAVAVVLVIDGEALAMAGRSLADEAPTALRLVELSVLLARESVGGFGPALVRTLSLCASLRAVVGHASRRSRTAVWSGPRSRHTFGDAVFAHHGIGHGLRLSRGGVVRGRVTA